MAAPAPLMGSSARRNLNLLLLALAMSGLALALGLDRRSKPEPTAGPWVAATDGVARIRAQGPGGARLGLARDGDRWWLTEPIRRQLRAERVRHLLNLAALRPQRVYSVEAIDLQGAGLATPAWQVWFDDRRVDLGGLEALGRRRYLAHESSVILAADDWLPLLDGGLSALVDLGLNPHGEALRRIRTPHAEVFLEGGDWRAVGAPGADAAALARAWLAARAAGVEPLGQSRPAQGEVLLIAAAGAEFVYRLELARPWLALVGRDADHRLLIDTELADRLLRLPRQAPAAGGL